MYVDKELDNEELRLTTTPILKDEFKRKANRTTLKLGGNFSYMNTLSDFDDDIMLREPERQTTFTKKHIYKTKDNNVKEITSNVEDIQA